MSLRRVLKPGFDSAPVYVLENRHGTCVEVCASGASILRVETLDCNKTLKNIALSYQTYASLLASKSCAGATIGPVAGRLRGGILRLPDRQYLLTRNDGAHTLHGGNHGLAQAIWSVTECGESFISLTCQLPDGLDGFPGNREMGVCYTLDDDNRLHIAYTAKTDQPTFLNLTNHTYWNLTGDFSTDVYGHLLEITADAVSYNDTAHLPVGLHPVQDTPFDFTAPRTLQQAIASDTQHPQLVNANGYNNAYLLRPDAAFAARLTDPASGRRLTMHTDYPALVLYSGGYLAVPGCSLALEAQYLPDSCRPVLLPGQIYHRRIFFTFDVV